MFPGEKEGKSMDKERKRNNDTGKQIDDLSNPDIAVRRAAVRQARGSR